MTEKIEKNLESKSLPKKHHRSTAEPDKAIQQVQAAWKDHPSVCVWTSGCMVSSDLRLHSETTGGWKTGQPRKWGGDDFREDPGFLQNDEIQSHSLNACPKIFQNVKRIRAKWQKCFFKKTKTWAGFLSSTTLAASLSVQSVNYSFWSSVLMTSRWPESQSCLCEKFSGKLGVSRRGVWRVWVGNEWGDTKLSVVPNTITNI